MPSHTRALVRIQKLGFFILRMSTTIQKTTAIPTAMLGEQGHKSGFEVISIPVWATLLTCIHYACSALES